MGDQLKSDQIASAPYSLEENNDKQVCRDLKKFVRGGTTEEKEDKVNDYYYRGAASFLQRTLIGGGKVKQFTASTITAVVRVDQLWKMRSITDPLHHRFVLTPHRRQLCFHSQANKIPLSGNLQCTVGISTRAPATVSRPTNSRCG